MSVFRRKAGGASSAPTRKNARLLFLQLTVLLIVSSLFMACQKDVSGSSKLSDGQLSQAKSSKGDNNGVTMTTTCFQAVAEIARCHGEDILFGGTIEMKENITKSSSGKISITRHFVVKDLMGRGVTGGLLSPANLPACQRTYTGTFTGTQYEVQGGAEMFNIHFSEGGSATLSGSDIFIHKGTLVFVNTATGERVVARHVITKVPGQGVKDNQWECGGNN